MLPVKRFVPLIFLGCWDDDPRRVLPSPDVSDGFTVTVTPTLTETETCDATCGCEATRFEYTAAQHISASIPIRYDDAPPTGGPHDPCWATWGVHTTPVAARNYVHNLEHGGVVFLYDAAECGAAGCETAALEALGPSLGANVLVSRASGLGAPYAALAWGHRLLLDCWDDAALRAFYTARQNQAPEETAAMPPGSCM